MLFVGFLLFGHLVEQLKPLAFGFPSAYRPSHGDIAARDVRIVGVRFVAATRPAKRLRR